MLNIPKSNAPKTTVFDTPPEFSLIDLISQIKLHCAETRTSAVRYLKLDGDERHRLHSRWSPSALRSCLRSQVYKAVGAPKADSIFDLERELIFDRGHVFGSWVAAYLEAGSKIPELGISSVQSVCSPGGEAVVHDPGTQISGFVDIVFTRFGHKYVVEVKSKEDAGAWTKITQPQPEHAAQFNDYLSMTGAKAGWVFYIGIGPHPRGNGKTKVSFKEFFRRYDPKLWQATVNQVSMLEWFMSDQTKLAPKTTKTFFECPNCPYREWCDADITPARVQEIKAMAEADAAKALGE